jgi:predicted mannosyl-3-phosphoglycerate phosphatase (HAD superfamily)
LNLFGWEAGTRTPIAGETTGIKLGYSKGELTELDEQFEALWLQSVEAEVNRRLAERGLTFGSSATQWKPATDQQWQKIDASV